MTAGAGLPRPLRLGADGRLSDGALLAHPGVERVLDLLNRDGDEARLVGGSVRNALLGLPPGDIDVTTTALPDVVLKRAAAARLRAIPTGLAHGTVTLMMGTTPIEVTTLREDVETDGRHAVVRFGRDFSADALRRDFTINAMSVDRQGRLHDVTGGLDDLAAGRVRFIGDADRRIREDYLRILRFFRFSASYAVGSLDPEGLAASIRHRDALPRLSRERLRAELLKTLLAPAAPSVLEVMSAAGITGIVLGGPASPGRLARLVDLEAACGISPDPLLRLAALALDKEADAGRLRGALRLSNEETTRLSGAALARQDVGPAPPSGPDALRALLYRWGRRTACDAVGLAAADAPAVEASAWAEALRFVRDALEPRLPLGGADVVAKGVPPGRAVGAVLKRLQAAWIRAGFPKDPATLSDLLDQAIADPGEGAGNRRNDGAASPD